jgi:hypothetical protein
LTLTFSQLHKISGVKVWRSAVAAPATGILTFGWTWSLGYGLDFLLGFWLFLLGVLPLEKGALALVGYGSATRIILSVKVKVLEGDLCAYDWVTILLYCLWKNEHVYFNLTGYGSTLSSDSLTTGRYIGSYLLSSLWHHLQLHLGFLIMPLQQTLTLVLGHL